jgi:hypothetical protein
VAIVGGNASHFRGYTFRVGDRGFLGVDLAADLNSKCHKRPAISAIDAPALNEDSERGLPLSILRAVDNWRRGQRDTPNRSEAIRRLVERGLAEEAQVPR